MPAPEPPPPSAPLPIAGAGPGTPAVEMPEPEPPLPSKDGLVEMPTPPPPSYPIAGDGPGTPAVEILTPPPPSNANKPSTSTEELLLSEAKPGESTNSDNALAQTTRTTIMLVSSKPALALEHVAFGSRSTVIISNGTLVAGGVEIYDAGRLLRSPHGQPPDDFSAMQRALRGPFWVQPV
jgi:hypothetical protein